MDRSNPHVSDKTSELDSMEAPPSASRFAKRESFSLVWLSYGSLYGIIIDSHGLERWMYRIGSASDLRCDSPANTNAIQLLGPRLLAGLRQIGNDIMRMLEPDSVERFAERESFSLEWLSFDSPWCHH